MNISFDPETLKLGAIWYLIFLGSTVLHEAAHAFFAYRLGDKTAYHGGHVTLNPMPHIKREPIGLIVVPVISFLAGGWMFGWASVPYNVAWAMRYPKRSALMSLAGPLANITLMVIAGVIIHIGYRMGFFQAPDAITFEVVTQVKRGGPEMLATVLSIVFSLNLILAIFNLLPLPGFDGSATPLLFVGKSMAHKIMKFMNSNYSLIVLFVAWKFFSYVYDPVQLFLINLLYPGMSYG